MKHQNNFCKFKQEFYKEQLNFHHLVKEIKSDLKTRSVHEIRVSSQKMVLFFDIIDLNHPEENLSQNKLLRSKILDLKKQTNKLRDYQVQKKIFLKDFESEEIISNFFKRKLTKNKNRLRLFLKNLKISKMQLSKFPFLSERCFVFYDRVLFDLKNKMLTIDSKSKPDDFHDLRKLLKRFVYLTEILHDLGFYAKVILTDLRHFQKKLGEVQDLTKTLDISDEILASCPQHFRKNMIEYRLITQIKLKDSMKSILNHLKRSPLCQN
jgi:CHAD domain-containing protein